MQLFEKPAWQTWSRETRAWEWRRATHLSPFCYLDWADKGSTASEKINGGGEGQTFFFFIIFKRNLRTNGLKVQSWIPPQKQCAEWLWLASVAHLIALTGLFPLGDEPDWKTGARLLKSRRWPVLQQGFILEDRVPKQDTKCQAKPLI